MSAQRTILLTGAGRGLGHAMATHLAAPGTHLLLHYGHSAAGAAAAAEAVQQRGGEPTLLQADLSLPAERERLMDHVAEACEALHVLVHNAAVYPDAGLLEITPAQWQEVVEIDCNAVFHLSHRALPLLRAAARPGAPARVVHIGDSAADRITARLRATPYHVAKLGVHVLTRSLAKALGPEHITVNMISPGFLEESLGEPGSAIPAGRKGSPEDILGALDYLLSPAAAYVSGANLVVSGGWNL